MKRLAVDFTVSLVVAVSSYLLLDQNDWKAVDRGLLFAFSILAGAAFVRAARGLPVTYNEHLEVEEVRKIAVAYQQITNKLIWIVSVFIFVIMILVFSGPFIEYLVELSARNKWEIPAQKYAIATVMFFVGYSMVCGARLLVMDHDFVKLQSKFLVSATQRNSAKRRQEEIKEASQEKPFTSPPGYGKLSQ